jgi:hemolysin III
LEGILKLEQGSDWTHGLILGDEWANSLTHAFGFLLSLVGFVFLLQNAWLSQDFSKILFFGIYGMTLSLLYASSMIYHGLKNLTIKKIFRTVDHCAIYLLIAGTYTPITMLVLRENVGSLLFSAIWMLAISGICFKIFFIHRFKKLSTAIYLTMGWLIILAIEPLMNAFPYEGLCWIVGGGASYTVGVIFYVLDKRKFFHAIWHLFVLVGSFCHYFAIYLYI